MTKRFSRAARRILTGLLVLVTVTVAHADFIAVPIALQNIEGNLSNAAPFNTGTLPSERYQQVYAASDFGSLDALLITALAFRPEHSNQTPFSVTLPDIQINLSTTTRQPDDLSPLFLSNLGADDAVVFARGSLLLSSAAIGPYQGPKDFDVLINLQNPFIYDPAKGNLLLDVRNFQGGNLGFSLDAEATDGDGVSRVWTNGDIPGGVDSPVGTTAANTLSTLGLVTRFTVTPAAAVVPDEPSTFVLLVMGMLTLLTSAACGFWKF